jgi:hypothetical protein
MSERRSSRQSWTYGDELVKQLQALKRLGWIELEVAGQSDRVERPSFFVHLVLRQSHTCRRLQ